MPQQLFSQTPLVSEVLRALETLGFKETTEIQSLTLQPILDGRDVLARSKTGSGKTVAFGAALLHILVTQGWVTRAFAQPRALVLCPTRELAEQVSIEIRRLGRFVANLRVVTLAGGSLAEQQRERLQSGAHIVVGTPGRVTDLLEKGEISFSLTQFLVLDEADRMLDLGFVQAIDWIIARLPKKKQTLLFSATIPEAIRQMSDSYQVDPVVAEAEALVSNALIDEIFIEIDPQLRAVAIEGIVKRNAYASVLIFCATKANCNLLAKELMQRGFHVLALHSDLEQRRRSEVLARFANKSSTLLVSTDVASRGLDIKDLEVVMNYDLSPDPEVHVHRMGRTGRAGKVGKVYSFVSSSSRAARGGLGAEKAAHPHHRLENLSAFLKRPLVTQSYSAFLEQDSKGKECVAEKIVPPMVTLSIAGGRKTKIRKGDILGALTGEVGMAAHDIGVIDVFDSFSYVAIRRAVLKTHMAALKALKIKGTWARVAVVDDSVTDMIE